MLCQAAALHNSAARAHSAVLACLRVLCLPHTGCNMCAVRATACDVSPVCTAPVQVSKYVEREILNHKRLIHPHIVQLKEVSKISLHSCLTSGALSCCALGLVRWRATLCCRCS